jgi:hypothetical protein
MSVPTPPARSGRSDRVVLVLLVVVGLYVILAPGFLGWRYFEDEGIELDVVRILVGFLFLFYAGLVIEKNRYRKHVADVYEAMNMLLYGKNYRRDRDAIRILLRGLESDDTNVRQKAWENLRRLTGQDFALDPSVWKSWWEVSEKRFALKAKRPDDS